MTTSCRKFPSIAHGNQSLSHDSRDGILMSPIGDGKTPKPVSSKTISSDNVSTPPPPTARPEPWPEPRFSTLYAQHTRDTHDISFFLTHTGNAAVTKQLFEGRCNFFVIHFSSNTCARHSRIFFVSFACVACFSQLCHNTTVSIHFDRRKKEKKSECREHELLV